MPTNVHVLPPSPLGVSLIVASPLTGVSSFVEFASSCAVGIPSTPKFCKVIFTVEVVIGISPFTLESAIPA